MVVLPSRYKAYLGRRLLGWDVHPTAYIGRSVLLVGHLSMGAGASIGPLNVIRDLEELRLAEGASIGSRNWITGFPRSSDPLSDAFPQSPNRRPSLIMGKRAMVTVAHEIDCADRVEIGDYSSLAGFRCTILTHSLNLVRDRFVTGAVEIGAHAAVMSGSTLLSGTKVPSRSIVSAHSVVNTPLTEELTFYSGNPAEAVRALPETLGFFHRGEDPEADQDVLGLQA
jgi:carbonic anhydrase/acetyltransferase-like protein (isoleucine patch superfamily)